jgi:hypothetical protein
MGKTPAVSFAEAVGNSGIGSGIRETLDQNNLLEGADNLFQIGKLVLGISVIYDKNRIISLCHEGLDLFHKISGRHIMPVNDITRSGNTSHLITSRVPCEFYEEEAPESGSLPEKKLGTALRPRPFPLRGKSPKILRTARIYSERPPVSPGDAAPFAGIIP